MDHVPGTPDNRACQEIRAVSQEGWDGGLCLRPKVGVGPGHPSGTATRPLPPLHPYPVNGGLARWKISSGSSLHWLFPCNQSIAQIPDQPTGPSRTWPCWLLPPSLAPKMLAPLPSLPRDKTVFPSRLYVLLAPRVWNSLTVPWSLLSHQPRLSSKVIPRGCPPWPPCPGSSRGQTVPEGTWFTFQPEVLLSVALMDWQRQERSTPESPGPRTCWTLSLQQD